jgi:hypothetical protein
MEMKIILYLVEEARGDQLTVIKTTTNCGSIYLVL